MLLNVYIIKFDIPSIDLIPVNRRHTEVIKFTHQMARSNAAHHSLFYRFPRLWEVLPTDVKETVIYSLSLFVNSFRKHLLVPGLGDALTQTV